MGARSAGGPKVSIHAPARGATAKIPPLAYQSTVSIHAPARGRDFGDKLFKLHIIIVSIHAPRGARRQVTDFRRQRPSGFNPRARAGRDGPGVTPRPGRGRFNPRARAGRDSQIYIIAANLQGFQSTARAGRDLTRHFHAPVKQSFNPRARAGRDARSLYSREILSQFQSTRPRGRDRLSARCSC